MTHIEQLREQITNTLIANECALDHVTGGAPAAKEIPIPGTERVMYIGRRADIERLLATTAGEQAEPAQVDRQKLLRVALDAADKWASTEHLHARDIGKGGRGDEKAVVRAENAARKAIAALAAPASPEQVQAEPRRALYSAAINCGHSIEEDTIILHRDSRKEGNALKQLGDRLAEAFAKLAAPIAAAPATREHARDKALLDFLDKWVDENRAEGWKEFHFAFDTNGTAREQIGEQMSIEAEAPAASKEGDDHE